MTPIAWLGWFGTAEKARLAERLAASGCAIGTPEEAELILLGVAEDDRDRPPAELLAACKTTRPVVVLLPPGAPCAAWLESGAADAMTAPYDADELRARIRKALRRHPSAPPAERLASGALELLPAARQVFLAGAPVSLSGREFDLLEFFMRHPGIVLSRSQLIDGVWGFDFDGETKVVDVYVGYLRRKLGTTGECLQSVRGIGYRFAREPEPAGLS